jgi:hypothetical protein
VDHAAEDETLEAATMHFASKKRRKFGLCSARRGDSERVSFTNPRELHISEINVLAAERIEPFVDCLFCGKNHCYALMKAETVTNPIELFGGANQRADVHPGGVFDILQVDTDRDLPSRLNNQGNSPRPAVSNRTKNALRPKGLATVTA